MKKLGWILIVVLIGLAVWFWLKPTPSSEDDAAVQPTAQVEVTALRREEITRVADAFGVITAAPEGEQVITAPFECVIHAIRTAVGARVAAGDVLLEIAPSADAKLDFESATSAWKLAHDALAATQERYKLQLAASQDLQSAQQAEEVARLKVESLRARGVDGTGQVVASAAGIVSRMDASDGAIVALGAPLVTVTASGKLDARLSVDAADLPLIQPGQRVTLRSVNRRDAAAVQSTVRQAAGAIDGATGSGDVRVPVPAGAMLLLGERVTAAIEVAKRQALVAPRRAVLPDGNHAVLFTVQDGKAVRHEVVVGIAAGDVVEVSDDRLHAGDPVVTLGNYELADGMSVIVGPAGAESAAEARP